jgi:hypothetical protein
MRSSRGSTSSKSHEGVVSGFKDLTVRGPSRYKTPLLTADENHMKIDKRMTDREKAEMDALTRAFFEKGGTIIRCPPGSSETVTYRNGQRRRPTTNEPTSPLKQDAQAISARECRHAEAEQGGDVHR